jgi:hypothetical protein
MVLMNDPKTMGGHHGEYELLRKEGSLRIAGTKEEIAEKIWKEIVLAFERNS